jgi:hypothetical protein
MLDKTNVSKNKQTKVDTYYSKEICYIKKKYCERRHIQKYNEHHIYFDLIRKVMKWQ